MINIKTIFLVILGSAVGGATRFITSELIKRKIPMKFPIGTFLVNILGCFLIGVVYAYTSKNADNSPQLKLLLATGFCGGFTTFSAFSAENMDLLKSGNHITAVVYILTSVTLGILATVAGNYTFK